MKNIKKLFFDQNLSKDSLFLIYFLLSIIVLAYIIPTFVFLSPSGTDVYTHMYNTLRLADSNSLFEFYEKSFKEEYLTYDYPFGLWFFGSIVMKVTGMDIHELAYILPLVLTFISVFLFYVYAKGLLSKRNKAILATIFMLSMPIITLSLLQLATRVFVLVFLTTIIYISINKFSLVKTIIMCMLVFSLVFSHTGTYMFLMFFSIAYFLLSALIWKKFDVSMYVLVVAILFFYVMAVQLFPYVQPQYIDKGRMVLSLSESFSSKLKLDIIKEMGKIFYDRIFVANNLIYVFFWSCFLFAIARFSLYFHSKILFIYNQNLLAIPIIGSIRSISHGIITTPFWLGPIHSILSVFGIFKLDEKGKCIALSLAMTSLLPGAMGSGEGTGALKEIYYLYLIIPISSVAGLCYIIPILEKYSTNKIKKSIINVSILFSLLLLLLMPIIGNLYYQPTISGTRNEKENLIWLSKTGSAVEGAPDFAYRERIDLYSNKLTPSIPQGSETRRYLNDLKNVFFLSEAEKFASDLYSFNIKYIISSERIINGFGKSKDSVVIDSNTQLDKIFSSDKNFGIYDYVIPPKIYEKFNPDIFNLELNETYPIIQDFGSNYLIENRFYKVKLSTTSPKLDYVGTSTKNFLGEGGFYDDIRISWSGAKEYKEKSKSYNFNELKYQISLKDNKLVYRAILKDENKTENWATLIVKYTFNEKSIKREIIIANDWVSISDSLGMNLILTSSAFAPITNFEFNQIGYGEEKGVGRKIYPSQDTIILKDKKFNEMYLNESGSGIFIKFGDSAPYPTKITYRGSTLYDYSAVSMISTHSLSPSESINLIQYFSVGDMVTARKNIEYSTSISQYLYPEAKIPVVLTGSISENYNSENSLNAYKTLQENGVTYNEGITPSNKESLRSEVNPLGYATLYEKWVYKDPAAQDGEIKKIKALGIKGTQFKSIRYNLDTIKILSDNNILFAEAPSVASPFLEFFREGLRNPIMAYYHGEETGVILLPVSSPSSSGLRVDSEFSNIEKVFTQWKEALNSGVEDGGVVVLTWNADDIGDPNYLSRFTELINYAKGRGMDFATPDSIANHFKLIQKVSSNVTRGIDYVVLESTNNNQEDVKGVTYKYELPTLNGSCQYSVENGRISREEIKQGKCWIFVSLDLKANEQKTVALQPNISRRAINLDFSGLFEGRSVIKVKDEDGNTVDGADVYVDERNFESNYKGEVVLTIRRGLHKIRVEKPGFISKDYEVEVKGMIYKFIGRPVSNQNSVSNQSSVSNRSQDNI
ncbi:MAG: hypothetical protein FIB08_13190 [Candidatus Methanoperedens sp.]|nr:hypothetical protein [Candidatus Methanoperedens sp.]